MNSVKKAEHRRIDAFELWCWRRLLRVPWTARRSNQSILKEISLGISLEGLMLKLKLQYFGHLMWRVDSLENTLMLGGTGGRRWRDDRGWNGWMASLTRWTWVWVNSRNWWWTGRPGVLRFMGLQRVRHDWGTEQNWTERPCFWLRSLIIIKMSILSKLTSKFNAILIKYQQFFFLNPDKLILKFMWKIKKLNIQGNSEKGSNIKELTLPDIILKVSIIVIVRNGQMNSKTG